MRIRKFNEGFKDRERKRLEEEMRKKQQELDSLNTDEPAAIIDLDQYTTEEKVQFFDRMYKMAKDYLDRLEEDGYADDDDEHWFFESGVTILNLKDKAKFWKYHNKLMS